MEYFYLVSIKTNEVSSEVIASLLLELGASGIVEQEDGLNAYFDGAQFTRGNLQSELEGLQQIDPFEFQIQQVENINWNEEWENNYKPLIIDDYVGIYAPFHEPTADTKLQLVINPRMAFGTGHHETTELMIQQMRTIDFSGSDVLDLGSGTGILAIIAQKEGAKSVTAVDIDSNAFAIMQENFEINNTPEIKSILGTIDQVTDQFDVILANITRNILLEESEQIVARLKSKAQLVLSGFYLQDLHQLIDCYRDLGLELISEKEKNNWCAVIFNK